MKSKIPNILFIISFVPYLLVLIYGIVGAFTGVSFVFNTVYGFDAFIIRSLSILYSMLVVPIIPVCLLFQVCYILKNKIKKYKNINSKKVIKICLIIGSILIGFVVTYFHTFEIEKYLEKVNAKQMIKNAEEKIGFNKNNVIIGGIFDIPEFEYNHILIDYDKKEIGMLLNTSIDEFWKIKLEKTTKNSSTYQHIINDYFMQVDVPLNYPGERLISFYENENLIHRTIAFLLIYKDGTIYVADNIKEKDTGFTKFTGLQWSEFFVGKNIKFKE